MSSSSDDNKTDMTRVMLWCVPRSTSTTFLKCMTYVPGTLAWYESYMYTFTYSKYGIHRKNVYDFLRSQGAGVEDNDDHLRSIEGGYLASEAKYSWLKEQFEATPPGKKMIFSKDTAWSVDAQQYEENLPSGFQHTFLIRNPYLTFDSFKRVVNGGIDDDKKVALADFPEGFMPEGSYYKEQYALYKYAKETLGQNPAIVDSDDLLANPRGVMKAYFKAIGVPFRDEYLHWEAGNECINKWVVPKEQIYSQHGWHEVTFKSTGFGNPKKCPARDDLADDVLHYGDLCMEYYEKMYADRLKPL